MVVICRANHVLHQLRWKTYPQLEFRQISGVEKQNQISMAKGLGWFRSVLVTLVKLVGGPSLGNFL